jgi:hypothetical protein
MTIQNKRIFASILFVLISFVCASQGEPPTPTPAAVPPGLVPIDGGVFMGVFFALIYGAVKMLKSKK